MNYFNVDAVVPVPIYMRTGWVENTYSEMWEYLEIKWISVSGISFEERHRRDISHLNLL